MSYAHTSRKPISRVSFVRSTLSRFVWKPTVSFFALIWRAIGWIWTAIIVAALEGITGNAGYACLTTGCVGIDLQKLGVIQVLQAYPLPTAGLGVFLVALTGLSYLAQRSQQRASHDREQSEYALRRVNHLDPGNYKLFRYVPQVYLTREADTMARSVLRELATSSTPIHGHPSLGVCIVGRPAQGKTRLAWEAMQAELPAWKLVRWSHEREGPFDFTAQRGQRIVLWLDDLHEFANSNEASSLNDLPRRFAESGARLIVIATCRDGDNETQANKYLENFLERLTMIVLPDISEEEEIQLAEALAQEGVEVHEDEFDGTPGSLLLGVQRMQGRYLHLALPAQQLLKAMKVLRSAGIYTYPESRMRVVARDLFDFDEGSWRTACEMLDREDFVRLSMSTNNERTLEPIADVYVEQAVTDYPSPSADLADDWLPLQKSLIHQHDAAGLTSLGIAFVERLLGNLRSHKQHAEACFRAALQVYTREHAPADWAMTQNNLGNALRDQAGLAEGSAQQDLLAQAVVAYRAALQVRTREHAPAQWAGTQNNLGNALRDQAGLAEGSAQQDLLAQAVVAYRAALQVYTREHAPADWAMTQNNLGNALRDQAGLAEGSARQDLLAQAVVAYRAALQVYTREHAPAQWAGMHMNLALVHFITASLEEDAESRCNALREASRCIEDTLSVFTQEGAPDYHYQATTLHQEIKEAMQEVGC